MLVYRLILALACLSISVPCGAIENSRPFSVGWKIINSGTEPLRGVHFAGPETGWAVGANGTILATSDGGATWTAQNSGTDNALSGFACADARCGWAVGANGTILATRDGGAHLDLPSKQHQPAPLGRAFRRPRDRLGGQR